MDDIKLSRKDSGNNSPIKKEGRAKAKSVFLVCKKYSFDQLSTLLEFNVQLSPTLQKKMNSQSLSSYTNRLVNQIYGSDMLGIGKVTIQFLEKDYSKHRQRVHQRISLLKYQAQTLKFKSFIDVQRQIVKQWRKNVLFASLNTIWITKMLTFKFSHLKQFSESYKKQVALISNLTHFYFKEALVILDAGKIATFNNLQEETAHKILNQLQDWEELYNGSLLPLIKLNNEKQKLYMDMNYETKILNINPNYLDLQSGEIALLQTAQKIRQFANKCTIHGKIQALKQMRSTFLRQIQQSRVLIAEKRSFQQFSTLEKDDVIGCMIYCIVAWKIDSIQASIQSLYELLGPNNQLLSRKGVDSYRADLQSAVQYLCQQGAAYSKQNAKHLEQKQSEIELAYKSTHLDLFGSI